MRMHGVEMPILAENRQIVVVSDKGNDQVRDADSVDTLFAQKKCCIHNPSPHILRFISMRQSPLVSLFCARISCFCYALFIPGCKEGENAGAKTRYRKD